MDIQKIETAPEYRRILVYNDLTGWYISKYHIGNFPMYSWGGTPGIWYPTPTHWTDLPGIPDD